MYFELFVASTFIAVGCIIFGRFEEGTARWRRLLKLAFFIGVTGFLSQIAGRTGALLWIFGAGVLGLSFHIWWCKKHGIGVLSAEPKEKYYQLRGWEWPK